MLNLAGHAGGLQPPLAVVWLPDPGQWCLVQPLPGILTQRCREFSPSYGESAGYQEKNGRETNSLGPGEIARAEEGSLSP